MRGTTYEGFETWTAALRMSVKMYLVIFLCLLLLHLVLFFALFYITSDSHHLKTTLSWAVAKPVSLLIPRAHMTFTNPDGTIVNTTASAIARSPAIRKFALSGLVHARSVFLWCAFIYLLFPLVLRLFQRRSRIQSSNTHVRGSRLISAAEFSREVKQSRDVPDLPFGSVQMPLSSEVKHTFIVGRPGTGKTVLLSQILNRLKERGERAIVYDFKGDYLSKFYDPAYDLIFNPLDSRSLGWRIMNEIQTYMDIDAVSSSLIPPTISSSDPFWNDAARDVFAGILHYLFSDQLTSNQDIWDMVTAEGHHIAKCLKDTKGGERGFRYIEDAGSKQAISVFSVLMQYAKCFEYMAQNDGDFSLTSWLNNGTGMIFITNYADVQDTLKPVLSLFIDLLGRKLLSMPDTSERKIFFLLDEFGTLQRLSTIIKLLTLSRSKGGCVFLGIQDFGQLDRLYSREHRQSIVNACGNSVIFSVADTVTAKYCSDKLGETEYMQAEKTLSMGVENFRDGTSLSIRKKREPLLLPADVMNLAELSGVVKFSNYDPVITRIPFKRFEDRAISFQLRQDLLLAGSRHPRKADPDITVHFEGMG